MIIAGADQSAFGLPHFVVNTKAHNGHFTKVKLMGVLDHGSVDKASPYLMKEDFETGTNHVVEGIHRTLCNRLQSGPLSDTFCLQMEKCTRKNKNRFTISYLEFLVQMGVSAEATAAFLPGGHTHEDIDQFFSRTASHLRHRDALTIEDLTQELRKYYTLAPTISILRHLANL